MLVPADRTQEVLNIDPLKFQQGLVLIQHINVDRFLISSPYIKSYIILTLMIRFIQIGEVYPQSLNK